METNCARYNCFPQMKGRKWGNTFEFSSILRSEHRLIACLISPRKRKQFSEVKETKREILATAHAIHALFTCLNSLVLVLMTLLLLDFKNELL